MVASGPTMPDSSTTGRVYALADHHLLDQFPVSIRRYFDQSSLHETPKPGDTGFGRSRYCRLLSNADAVEAARGAAENAGLVTKVDEGRWDADFRKVARAAAPPWTILRQKIRVGPFASWLEAKPLLLS